MMTKYSLPAFAVLLTIGAGAALAQAEADPMVDTDGDGAYSFAELQAVYPDFTEEGFAEIDSNADGLVDPAEAAAATEAGTMPTMGEAEE